METPSSLKIRLKKFFKVFLTQYSHFQTVSCWLLCSFSNHWTCALCWFYPTLEVTGAVRVTLILGLQRRRNDLIWSFLSWGVWGGPIPFMKFLQEKMSTVHAGGEAGGLRVGRGRRQCGQFFWPRSRRGHPAEESAESLLRALGVGSGGSAGGPGAPGVCLLPEQRGHAAGAPQSGPSRGTALVWSTLRESLLVLGQSLSLGLLVLCASPRQLVIHALGFGVPGSGVSLSSEWVFFKLVSKQRVICIISFQCKYV